MKELDSGGKSREKISEEERKDYHPNTIHFSSETRPVR